MMKFLFGAVLTCLSAAAVLGADYYVDSESGLDENSGLSAETPWKTLDKVNDTSFAPGDVIHLKCGSLWRESLHLKSAGTEESPIIYTSYGEGPKPILCRSIPLNREEFWIPDGENVWVTSDEISKQFGSADIGNIILDGDRAAFKKWGRGELLNQDDFWYDLKGDRRVRFWSTVNPARVHQTLEAAQMRNIVDHTNASCVTVDGLDIRYGAAHGFGGRNARHLTIRNCDISWIGGGDQYSRAGEGKRVRYGNGIEFWAEASDCLVENNRIWEVYDAALTNQGDEKNIEENITYRGNVIWNCEYGFEYWNGEDSVTRNILFEENFCFDSGYGWGHYQRPNKNGRAFLAYRNSARTENFVMRNNVFLRASESLVRVDFCPENPDWTKDGLKMEGNRYENGDLPLFRWLGKEYAPNQFEEFRSDSGQEL